MIDSVGFYELLLLFDFFIEVIKKTENNYIINLVLNIIKHSFQNLFVGIFCFYTFILGIILQRTSTRLRLLESIIFC